MISTRAAAIAALLATVGFASLPAIAQNATPNAQGDRPAAGAPASEAPDHRGPMMRHGGKMPAQMGARMQRGNGTMQILAMSCAPRGAERMETGFERLAERLSLSDEQQALFDTLMASALSAQTSYADRCAELAPERGADNRPDLLQRLETRLQLDEARLEAFSAVLPDFRTFYESLDEKQQADLLTRRGERGERGDRARPQRDNHEHRENREHRQDREHREDRPGRPG